VRIQRSCEGRVLPIDASAVARRACILTDLLEKNGAELTTKIGNVDIDVKALKGVVGTSEKQTSENMKIMKERIDKNKIESNAKHDETVKVQKKQAQVSTAKRPRKNAIAPPLLPTGGSDGA
jgi:hypothetical protein